MKQFSSGQALVGLGLSAEGDEAVSVSPVRGSSWLRNLRLCCCLVAAEAFSFLFLSVVVLFSILAFWY